MKEFKNLCLMLLAITAAIVIFHHFMPCRLADRCFHADYDPTEWQY